MARKANSMETRRDTLTGIRTKPTWIKAVELTAMGLYGVSEVADLAGVARNTLWDWKKKPEFFEDVCARQRLIFSELVPKALKTLEECFESENSKVRLDAARLVLDRTVYSKESGTGDVARGTTPVQVNIQVNYD